MTSQNGSIDGKDLAGSAPVVGRPDPEVPERLERARRRQFTVGYKLRILSAANSSRTTGEIGARVRREGLYSSHLTTWRAARERGDLAGPTVAKRGPVPRVPDPRDKRIAELERATAFWRKRAERAEALIEVQKNIAALLGTPAKTEHSS